MHVHTITTFVGIPIDAMQHQPLELLQAFWTYHMKTSNFGSLPTTLQAYPLSPKPTFATFQALHHSYSIAGNFRGRKLLQFCGYSWKFFCEIGRHSVLRCSKSEQSAKVFSTKIANSRKFFLQSFPLYGIISCSTSSPTHTLSNDSLQCTYLPPQSLSWRHGITSHSQSGDTAVHSCPLWTLWPVWRDLGHGTLSHTSHMTSPPSVSLPSLPSSVLEWVYELHWPAHDVCSKWDNRRCRQVIRY